MSTPPCGFINARNGAGGKVELQLLRDVILYVIKPRPLKVFCKGRLNKQAGIIDVARLNLIVIPVDISPDGYMLREEIDIKVLDQPEGR